MIEKQLIDLLLQWDYLERKNDNLPIIDFNLLDLVADKSDYKNRWEILEALKSIQKQAANESEQLLKRINAHIYYLRALIGQKFPFEEYIQNTQHIPLVYYQDDYINILQESLKQRFNDLNINLNSDTLKKLNNLEKVFTGNQIIEYFQKVFQENKAFLSSILEANIDFNLKMELVNIKTYWACWIDGKGNNFRLRINQENQAYTHSRIVQMAFHELLAHCVQMTLWRRQILQKKMNPVWGLTTVHAPTQFLFEGLAQTLPLFLDNKCTNDSILQARIYLWHFNAVVKNNLHVMINQGSSVEDCIDFCRAYSPWISIDSLLIELNSRSNSVLFKSYQYVYPSSFDFFLKLAQKLLKEQKKEFLKKCYFDILLYIDFFIALILLFFTTDPSV